MTRRTDPPSPPLPNAGAPAAPVPFEDPNELAAVIAALEREISQLQELDRLGSGDYRYQLILCRRALARLIGPEVFNTDQLKALATFHAALDRAGLRRR